MSHQDRRDPLPKDYQFGDAGKDLPATCAKSPDGRHRPELRGSQICGYCHRTFSYLRDQGWRAPHETAAEQLKRRGEYNVIEGEHE